VPELFFSLRLNVALYPSRVGASAVIGLSGRVGYKKGVGGFEPPTPMYKLKLKFQLLLVGVCEMVGLLSNPHRCCPAPVWVNFLVGKG